MSGICSSQAVTSPQYLSSFCKYKLFKWEVKEKSNAGKGKLQVYLQLSMFNKIVLECVQIFSASHDEGVDTKSIIKMTVSRAYQSSPTALRVTFSATSCRNREISATAASPASSLKHALMPAWTRLSFTARMVVDIGSKLCKLEMQRICVSCTMGVSQMLVTIWKL